MNPSRAQELADDRKMLLEGISFLEEKGPASRPALEQHREQLAEVEQEIALLEGRGGSRGTRVQTASGGARGPQPTGQRAAGRSGEEGRRAGMPAMVCSVLGTSIPDPVLCYCPGRLRASPNVDTLLS